MHVKVRKLDVLSLKPHRICLLLGRRGSGKSVLLRDILANLTDRFDFALAMCPTLESSKLLKEHMPECCVYDRYVQSKVDALVKCASECAVNGKARNFLLILDDVLYDKTVCRTQSFRYLFYNGRHAKISCIVLCQYLIDIPPDMRAQIDYVFTMKENTIQNRLKLYKMFFGVFATFDDFCAVLDRCTQHYEALVLDNTLQTNTPTDCVFWYKAKMENGDFRLGRDIFFSLQERHRRLDILQTELTFDDEIKPGSRQKVKLIVSKEEDQMSDDNER
uniref:Uncharacterized protein n=1 Tax=viral metagenome TaxID=1070528 RepID=A0A6C0BZE0_9ZZZZ